MADIRLAKPAAGTTQTVPSAPNGRFIFDFPADAATLTRNGDDLVLTFEDGSSIQLQGFYTTYSKEEMPSFQVEGVEISGQDFFAALGEDLMPAAGPAASSASRSGRYNEYGGSDLLDGIDHLGRLDIGFDGGTQLATDTVEPSAPEVDIDYDVTIAAGSEAGAVDLTVYEGGLAGGSQAGQAATPTTASGSLNINAPDGVASIVIGDVVVYENGKLTGNVVTTDEGTLAVTGYDPVTGKLDFSYTLDRNTTEHDKSDPATDTQISHDLTVTVTDTDGDSDSTTITVNVVDDVPSIGSFSHEISEGDAVPVVGNALTGAVAGADGANFAWDANQNGHFGTITLNADGTYSYRLDNDNATVKELTDGETLTEEFTYTYTDADGDIAEGKVTITINGKDNGIVIEPTDPAAGSDTVTVYESGLADGSQTGQDDAPTTASGSLIITAPDGVASIVIGGIVVFEKGGLTGNTVSTDEGTLTVTGFDPVTGELKFTYELSGNTTEHSGSGMDDISHDLTVTVMDMDGTEVDSTITVDVVDDVPTAHADSFTLTEAQAQAGGSGENVLSNDVFGADAPADKTVTSIEGGTLGQPVSGKHGELTLNADGSYSYKLNAGVDVPKGESVTEEFTYTITDADDDTSEATLTITIRGDEDVPVVTVETPEAGDANIMVDEGALVGGSGQHTEHGVSGSGSFTVNLNGEDGVITVGGESGWKVTVTGDSANVTGSVVTVNGVAVTVTGATQAADGSWTVNYSYKLTGDQHHETPADGNYHADKLTGEIAISVTDATGDTAEGTLTVEVHDDGPVAKADDVTLTEAQAQAGGSGENVLSNDVFGADAPADKTVTSIEGGTLGQPVSGKHGELTLNADGSYSYKLNAGVDVPKGESVTEEFTYTITDADDDTSEATLTITIRGDEDVPVVTVETPEAGDANIMVDEGALVGGSGQHTEHGVSGSGSFTVNLNGEDGVITVGGESGWKVTVTGDSANVTGSVVTVNGVAVTVTGATQAADGSWTVNYSYKLTGDQHHETPADGNYHADKLTGEIAISVTDATGDTAEGTLTVEVHDDGPVAKADDVTLTEAEAQAGGSGDNVLANDVFGADAPADKTVTSIEGGTLGQPVKGTYGNLTLNENGTYTYQLNAGVDVPKGETYTEEFTYTIMDKDGDTSEATLTITIKGDENVPVVTVETPGAGDANIMVDEGALDGGSKQHTEHGASGSGSFTVQLNGEDGVITLGYGEQKVELKVENGEFSKPEAATITVNGVAVTVTGATQGADGWTVNYSYELQGDQPHTEADSSDYYTDELRGTITVDVVDATGDSAAQGSITVEVHDDGPTITASDMSTTVVPGSGAGNLADGEAADFTKGTGGQSLGHSTNLSGWEGVTMTAAKVYYNGFGDNVQISDIDDNGSYTLKYSPYKGSDNDKADWGLTVDAGEHNEEISVIDGTASEAVIFDLGGQLAYGVTIDFGAFYSGDGTAGTTAWDHVSEKALVTFYRDGQIVGSTVVEGNSPDGKFTLNSSDVVLGGFDKVVISAVDNSTTQFPNENSDFTIQGIDFITKRDDPIIINEGKVTAESGADGFADAYADSHAKFDLAGMVDKNGGTLNEDGTSGTIMVLMDGSKQKVTLELSEGLSGESILTGTLADGEQLFTATLDKDGNWTMEQYDQFRVPGEEGQSSNQFELVFKTEDADGDIAGATVKVPLEVVDHTPGLDTSIEIDNGNDTIVIHGGDGVAGTVAAGDTGGVVEGQQVAANYNVCFILDMSTSMTNNRIGGDGPDSRLNRLEAAEQSIQNFITSIEGNTDFTDGSVTVAVIPFAEDAANPIEITITKVAGATTYSYEGRSYASFEAFSRSFVNDINRADVDSTSVTDYGPAFSKAAAWFDKLGDSVENATGNITYFLTDGRPAGAGTDDAYKDDYQRAWNAYQELLSAQGDGHINIHAIGFGNDLSDADMENLAMFDNTAQSVGDAHAANGWFEASDGVYAPGGITYEHPETIDRDATYYVQIQGGLQEVTYSSLHREWGYYRSGWSWRSVDEGSLLEQVIVSVNGGTSQQVTNTGSLTAAFESGFRPDALVAVGSDEITAADSASSVIVYGDVMNTDRLLYELNQIPTMNAALVAAGIGYGSGTEVFQWLENPDNADLLAGTKYKGWTHTDTVDYMLEHAEELGYETLVSDDGMFYLVDAHGDVWNMDGSEAGIALDDLTGRGGGNDVITGSEASDTIYGQEGDDIIYGGSGHDTLYGGTGDDLLVGDDKPEDLNDVTVESIKKLVETDALDDFIKSVEGTDDDGNDQLFGGVGDDVLLGMGGDDYLDGGAGEDAIFGGAGNDIIVYDSNDYLVSGGSGIDFMVSNDSKLTMEALLSGGKDGKEGPIVDSIEVLLKGEDALSLTSIQELADKYGITLSTNDKGEETLSLDDRWIKQEDGTYDFTGDADLTLETNLTPVDASDPASEAVQQQVFTLEHGNG